MELDYIQLWIPPIIAVIMIIVALRNHFADRRKEASAEGMQLLPVQEESFLRRLQLVVAWTRQLEEGFDSRQGDYKAVFRKTIPVIKDKPVFDLEGQYVRWNVEPDDLHTMHHLYFLALQPRLSPALVPSLREITRMGSVVVVHVGNSLMDGSSEKASQGYVDKYDLPPLDTWFYLSQLPDKAGWVIYCWVPAAFEEVMTAAEEANTISCYGWPDIYQLLPGQLS